MHPEAVSSPSVEVAKESSLAPANPTSATDWERECYRSPIRLYRSRQPAPMTEVEIERAKVCPSTQRLFDCEMSHADIFLQHQRYELATPILRRLALDPESGDRGLEAARLYIESLDRLGSNTDPPRPSCFSPMAADIKQILMLYCEVPGGGRSERCSWFRQLDNDVERMAAERLVERADMLVDRSSPSSPKALALYREGGDRYLALFDRACRARMPDDPDRYRKCDEVIYNAYRSYRAARAVDKAQAARQALLDPRNNLLGSPLVERVKSDGAR